MSDSHNVIYFLDGTARPLKERELMRRELGWLVIYTRELDMSYEPAGMAYDREIASFPSHRVREVIREHGAGDNID